MKKEEEKSLTESILALTKFIKKTQLKEWLKLVNNPKKFFFYNFLLGIIRGFGWAVGAFIVFSLIIWLLLKLTFVPFLGDWITNLINYIQENRLY